MTAERAAVQETPRLEPGPGVGRQDVILSWYPLVRIIACRMARRLPPSVDVDELINVGVLGLIDAIDRFDPERGVPFKSYAEIRIQGAMYDALRQDDWVPRSVRRKFNRIDQARTALSRELGRAPTRKELAERLGTTLEEFEALERDARINRLVSLDLPATEDGATPLVERLSRNEETAEDAICEAELREQVVEAVSHLPEKERIAVTLYYMQGMTLREIGELLGVTESRACQLRGQGVRRLRFRLRRAVG